jgi:uncharacterized protein (UPF0548 family)
MTEYRIGRGWDEAELKERLGHVLTLERNFDTPIDEMSLETGWNHYYSQAVVGSEAPGPPVGDGPFERGQKAVANYWFSDPQIVIGHFDPHMPLHGRPMLLEMRAMRMLRYLGGVVVAETRWDQDEEETVFGFRYDTLEGHIERGYEWFLLTKDHASGKIRFRIEAYWKPGQFPNLWSRIGFRVAGPHYQRKWHQEAHAILSRLMRDPDLRIPDSGKGRLVHTIPEVTFNRTKARHA